MCGPEAGLRGWSGGLLPAAAGDVTVGIGRLTPHEAPVSEPVDRVAGELADLRERRPSNPYVAARVTHLGPHRPGATTRRQPQSPARCELHHTARAIERNRSTNGVRVDSNSIDETNDADDHAAGLKTKSDQGKQPRQ
jgi:hypothetical protein